MVWLWYGVKLNYGIGMVWYGMGWDGMVWYGMVWYGPSFPHCHTVEIMTTAPIVRASRAQSTVLIYPGPTYSAITSE